MKTELPGVDVSGEIIAVGRMVAQFKPGDAVFGAGKGAFAEYVCTSEAKLAAKPESVSFEQAASIPIAGVTALQALRDKGSQSKEANRRYPLTQAADAIA